LPSSRRLPVVDGQASSVTPPSLLPIARDAEATLAMKRKLSAASLLARVG
jgi:hypothetical protein